MLRAPGIPFTVLPACLSAPADRVPQQVGKLLDESGVAPR
jgi:hypothetical protein